MEYTVPTSEMQAGRKCPSCVFIGATDLLIKCATLAQDHGWQVGAIVSEDDRVISWAGDNDIATHTWRSFAEDEPGVKADALFSVVNPYIVPRHLLDRFGFTANFHDALLPGHRGVNCASWALALGERLCGVTWHEMDVTADTGATICQGRMRVRDEDSAFSLALRCATLGSQLFGKVLEVASGHSARLPSLPGTDRPDRLHRRRDLPPNGGVLLWSAAARDLCRLVQATDTGPAPNLFGSALLVTPDGCFSVLAAGVRDYTSTEPRTPGTILTSTMTILEVACREGVFVAREIVKGNSEPVAPCLYPSLQPERRLHPVGDSEIAALQRLVATAHDVEVRAARVIGRGCSVPRAGTGISHEGRIGDLRGSTPGHALAAAVLALSAASGDSEPRFVLVRPAAQAEIHRTWEAAITTVIPVQVATGGDIADLVTRCTRLTDDSGRFIRSDLPVRYRGRTTPRWDFAFKDPGVGLVPAQGFDPQMPLPEVWPLAVTLDEARQLEPPPHRHVTIAVGSDGDLSWSVADVALDQDTFHRAAARVREATTDSRHGAGSST